MAKILVVDDETGIRDFAKVVLAHEGHEIIEAPDGGSGYNMAVSERPDVILLDVIMPVVDGFEALKKLKENPETASISVVLMTAVAAAKGESAAMAMGVEHYLSKPFKRDTLEAAIRVCLRETGKYQGAEVTSED